MLSKTPWTHKQFGPHNSLLPFTAIDSSLRLFLPAGTVNSRTCFHSLPGLWNTTRLYGNTKHKALEMYHTVGRKKPEYSSLGKAGEGADSRQTDKEEGWVTVPCSFSQSSRATHVITEETLQSVSGAV